MKGIHTSLSRDEIVKQLRYGRSASKEADDNLMADVAALTTPPAKDDAGRDSLVGRLRYVATILTHHADKFPVPAHIPANVAAIREAVAALTTPPAKDDAGRLREAVSDSQATLSAIKAECTVRASEEEDQMASHIADICHQTMISNAAALSPQSGEGEERNG